jgi:hypothetical protein
MSEQKKPTRFDMLNDKQKEFYTKVIDAAKGLSYKDAKRAILDLLEDLAETAIITSPK